MKHAGRTAVIILVASKILYWTLSPEPFLSNRHSDPIKISQDRQLKVIKLKLPFTASASALNQPWSFDPTLVQKTGNVSIKSSTNPHKKQSLGWQVIFTEKKNQYHYRKNNILEGLTKQDHWLTWFSFVWKNKISPREGVVQNQSLQHI